MPLLWFSSRVDQQENGEGSPRSEAGTYCRSMVSGLFIRQRDLIWRRVISPPLHGVRERPSPDSQAGLQAIVVCRPEVNPAVHAAKRRLIRRLHEASELPNHAGQAVRSADELRINSSFSPNSFTSLYSNAYFKLLRLGGPSGRKKSPAGIAKGVTNPHCGSKYGA